jgi:hypothetical protein
LRHPHFDVYSHFGSEEAGIVIETANYLRWNMRPNLDTVWNGATFRTNSHGFRTPEIALNKPPSTYRIVVFGSSNTMGYGVNDEEIYTRHLERWLNQCVAPPRRIEVVNLAISGDSPSRRLVRLEQESQRFQPDWLLCDASPFDWMLEATHVHAAVQRNLVIPFAFVREAIDRAKVCASDSPQAFEKNFQDEAERMYDDVYAAWSAVALRLKRPLTVLILPRADGLAKAHRAVDLIKSIANRHGLDYLDLTDAFDEGHDKGEKMCISDWDKHPNARGHYAIFEELRDAILIRGGMPGVRLSQPPPF